MSLGLLADCAIVMPALNEEAALARVLPALLAMGPARLIVADNGSTDATAEVAGELGAEVIPEPRRGYGAACWAGAEAVADDPAVRVLLFVDADGSDDPAALPELVTPILKSRADFVLSRRIPAEDGVLTATQRWGNRLAVGLIRLGWGFRYTDLGPLRAIRKELFLAIGMRDRAFGWTLEMQVRAVEMGARIAEINLPYRRRIGVSKISGTLRGATEAGYWILTTLGRLWWTRRRRMRRRQSRCWCPAADPDVDDSRPNGTERHGPRGVKLISR